jgi:alpha-mannosidase
MGRHTFHFALEPRGAPPPSADLYRSARGFLSPPLVVPAAGGGRWPGRQALLTIATDAPGSVVMSAFKKTDERDSLLLRVFNPGTTDARVRIDSALPLTRAFAVDFLERTQQELPVDQGRVTVVLPPGRIQAIELVPNHGAGR